MYILTNPGIGQVTQTSSISPTSGSTLFQQLQDALRQGAWSVAIGLSLLMGDRDENKLTDMVFFARRNASNKNQPLTSSEKQEWIRIRNHIVRPTLHRLETTSSVTKSTELTTSSVKINNVAKGKYEGGVGAKGTKAFQPDLNNWRDIVLATTGKAEGGYDTVNMYDQGILSWGVMQWTFHAGSLQKALAFIQEQLTASGEASLWTKLFPDLDIKLVKGKPQLSYKGNLVIGQPKLRQLFRGATAEGEFKQETIRYWAAVFAQAGRHPTIQKLQKEYGRLEVDNLLKSNLGKVLSSYKLNVCEDKKTKKPTWKWICQLLSESAEFYRNHYGSVDGYIGNDLKATALFFGMWTNNPAAANLHLKFAIDTLAKNYGTYDIKRWGTGWQSALTVEFERILRASHFAYWGDAKAQAAKPKPRKSRTQKILDEFERLIAQKR
jgi:hypothetical protein